MSNHVYAHCFHTIHLFNVLKLNNNHHHCYMERPPVFSASAEVDSDVEIRILHGDQPMATATLEANGARDHGTVELGRTVSR